MSFRTESEDKFERYLTTEHLTWTRIPESTQKQPDYSVQHGETICVFEVKEFDEPGVRPVGGFDPLPPIRHKIKRAAEKFSRYRDQCCAVVLWGSKSIVRTAHQSVVFPAAFGRCINTEPDIYIDPGCEPRSFHFSGIAALTAHQNTTVSAVIVLAEYELNHVWVEAWCEMAAREQRGERTHPGNQMALCQQILEERGPRYSFKGTIRTIVFENPHARVSFPPDLFVGPFDQHWRCRLRWFQLAFMGSDIEHLKRDGVPSIFW